MTVFDAVMQGIIQGLTEFFLFQVTDICPFISILQAIMAKAP